MPTIDQLESGIVASDEDVIPVSQNGMTRRITRSQLLAGTQPTLAFTPGLVGRVSLGLGTPEQITIGGGLSLSGGVLSGAPRYSVGALPLSSSAGPTDLVPVWQDGRDNAVSVRALLSVSGVDVSSQVAKASLGSARRLEEWFGDTVTVEAYGARGDGATDDTAAINLAIASGRPVLLGPRTYRVDGQWNIQASATLIGTVGATVLRRVLQSGGAWISVTAPTFKSIGIIYDAGNVDGDSWAVLVGPNCVRTVIRDCTFMNARGATLGSGLTIEARDGVTGRGSSHSIVSCCFRNNHCHGLWVQAASGASISDCEASNNGAYGICVDFNDPLFQQTARQSSITQSRCWNNTRGISIGNYNSTNREPPRWGLENPDATDITVYGNICSANSAYGIAISGARIRVVENQVFVGNGSASGILCNASLATVADNSVVGPGEFGVDAGGSADTSIISNIILNCSIGINAGGSARIHVASNKLLANTRAITVFQVETDGQGANFGISCSDIWIEGNVIQIADGFGGVFLYDGPERIEITRNRFLLSSESSSQNLCWAHTDSVTIADNKVNGSSVVNAASIFSGSGTQIAIPDIIDGAVIAASTTKVDAVSGLHQMAMVGQVSFVRVTDGGRGYTWTKVLISGSGSGAGALGSAYLRDGVVIGIALSSGGSGYDPATTSATIIGDGQGALLRAVVGLPSPQDRRVSLRCLSSVHFTHDAQAGIQNSWTRADFTVAAGSEVVLLASGGTWQAVSFESIDYVQPGGDGSVSLRSLQGDIRLSAGVGSGVRFQSNEEQSGFLTYFGRGSPEGAVTAPPGSDYRNLNGGAGSTLWLKRVGIDSNGWFAIA